MSKPYVDGGICIEIDKDLRVWLGINDEYYFDETQLQNLCSAYLDLYSSKSEDIKTEYHNQGGTPNQRQLPWLLR